MINYCQECGEKVEEKFQFCPFCGKKLIKPKICSNCGFKLKDKYQFCPECGTKWNSSKKQPVSPIPKKSIISDGYENIEEEKQHKEIKPPKKKHNKRSLPKISFGFVNKFKKSKKILLTFLVIIIIIIAAGVILIVNPFNLNNNTSGGSFSITIQNNYDEDIQYYLTVDGYYGIGGIDNPFELTNGDKTNPISVNENDLIVKKNSHSVTLFVFYEALADHEIATNVTNSVDFIVNNVYGEFNITYTV